MVKILSLWRKNDESEDNKLNTGYYYEREKFSQA